MRSHGTSLPKTTKMLESGSSTFLPLLCAIITTEPIGPTEILKTPTRDSVPISRTSAGLWLKSSGNSSTNSSASHPSPSKCALSQALKVKPRLRPMDTTRSTININRHHRRRRHRKNGSHPPATPQLQALAPAPAQAQPATAPPQNLRHSSSRWCPQRRSLRSLRWLTWDQPNSRLSRRPT